MMDIPFLQEFFDISWLGNSLGQYLLFLLIVLGFFLVGKTLYYFFKFEARKLTAKTKNRFDDLLLDMIEEPLVLLMVLIGVYIGLEQLVFDASLTSTLDTILYIVFSLNILWFIVRFTDGLIKEYLTPFAGRSDTQLDDQLVPVIQKGLKAIIIILGIIAITGNLGYDLTAIIAGLGIGGIAIAFAAQDTISNIFGGVTIFMDRPMGIGDRIKVGEVYGNVVDIGIRSTKVKTLDNTIITIPNSVISKSNVENFVKPDPSLKQSFKIGLTYDTSSKKLQEAMQIIKEIIVATDGVKKKDPLVNFTEFDDSSLNILAIYWVKSTAHILDVKNTVNLEIKKRFEDVGIDMAYPTQTLYLKK